MGYSLLSLIIFVSLGGYIAHRASLDLLNQCGAARREPESWETWDKTTIWKESKKSQLCPSLCLPACLPGRPVLPHPQPGWLELLSYLVTVETTCPVASCYAFCPAECRLTILGIWPEILGLPTRLLPVHLERCQAMWPNLASASLLKIHTSDELCNIGKFAQPKTSLILLQPRH